MKEILDDEFNNPNTTTELTQNIILKSLLYLSVMLFGGMLYMKYISKFDPTLFNMFYGSIVLLLFTLLVCGIFTIISSTLRKKKETKEGVNKIYDPIWFRILVNGFIWWSVCMIIIILGKVI